ncbi:MAG: hypothetical protein MJ079_05410 [Ruminococcus sp.]|nr:hypothetical protein [Ruminococcus sp.]
MKYQKDFKKVSFGFGNERAAGYGRLSDQHDTPSKNVDDKTALVTLGLQLLLGAVGIAAKIFMGNKSAKKKKKKKAKKSAK